jgi:hypothetical protein
VSSNRITTGYYEPMHGAWPLEAMSIHFSIPIEAKRMCGVISATVPVQGVGHTPLLASEPGVRRRVPIEQGLGPSGVSTHP